MIHITEDSFDDLSQMDQQFLNPTALNFREVGPQVDANYDDAFQPGRLEKIAYKLSGEGINDEPIREVPVGRYTMEAIHSAIGKPLSFSDKIKDAVIKAEVEKYNTNRDPAEFAFSQQAHNLYNSARDNYYQNDSNFNDETTSHLAMSESTTVDRDTLNLMYNYGKTELQKDIAAFGKHHLLSEDDMSMNGDYYDDDKSQMTTIRQHSPGFGGGIENPEQSQYGAAPTMTDAIRLSREKYISDIVPNKSYGLNNTNNNIGYPENDLTGFPHQLNNLHQNAVSNGFVPDNNHRLMNSVANLQNSMQDGINNVSKINKFGVKKFW